MVRKVSTGGEFGVFTLSETSVGRGGYNKKRSDVQLIQFFLRHFYKRHGELFPLLPKTKTGSGLIIIDGNNGGQTEKGILIFQKNRAKLGEPISVDGLVDVAHSGRSTISHTYYTIHYLNTWFHDHGERNEFQGSLENHPDILAYAPELRSELIVAKAVNGDGIYST